MVAYRWGRGQGQGGVNGVIEGVDNIMGRPRMVGVGAKHLLGYGPGLHSDPKRRLGSPTVPEMADRPQEGNGVKCLNFCVLRIAGRQPLHCLRVRKGAFGIVPLSIQNLLLRPVSRLRAESGPWRPARPVKNRAGPGLFLAFPGLAPVAADDYD